MSPSMDLFYLVFYVTWNLTSFIMSGSWKDRGNLGPYLRKKGIGETWAKISLNLPWKAFGWQEIRMQLW